jgi:predicted DNA-binding transcriptional regulator YafY
MTEQTRRASRLLAIERLIRRFPAGRTVAELAIELGYSKRTIQRDIGVLESELGIPLLQIGRRYAILPDAAPLAPIRFTLQEARAVLLAIRLFARHSDLRDPDAVSAMEKIADSLPASVANVIQATVEELRKRPPEKAQVEILRTITECWARSRSVAIRYRSQASQSEKVTALDPYFLEPSADGAATYVIGYSHAHGEVRTFRLSRIVRASASSEAFDPPPLEDMVSRIRKAWGVVFDGEEEYDIVVDFAPSVATRVSETIWHTSQQVTPLPDGRVRLQARLPSLMEFLPWVRSWGPEARAVSPPELVRRVAEGYRAAAALYDCPEE